MMGPAPRRSTVHGALILTQVMFGAGSIVAALGLPSFNPLLFAAIREAVATAILLAAVLYGGSSNSLRGASNHWKLFLALGACIFGNQVGYIVGIKLAGGVAGAVWQPSQPVLTAFFASVLGREAVSKRKVAGIACAFFGCILMVTSKSPGEQQQDTNGSNHSLGHLFFLINCAATSCYVLISKSATLKFPSLTVTALSYCSAAPMTALVALVVTAISPEAACSDCDGRPWSVPSSALPALGYWIIFQSVAAYALMTWATRHAQATVVSVYTALQPVTASALSLVLVLFGSDLVELPTRQEIGAAATIVAGLYVVVVAGSDENEEVQLSPSGGDKEAAAVEMLQKATDERSVAR